jgi:hypothetical protein
MAQNSAADLLRGMGIKSKDGKLEKDAHLKMAKLKAEDREKAYAAAGILKDRGKTQEDLIKKIDKRIGLEDKFNKKLGFGGQLAGGLDKAMQKAGMPALGIASSIEEARKNFIKTNGASSVFKDTVKGIGKNLKNALSSANLMQFAFGALIKALKSVDKDSGEFAKNNGISYQRTLQIRGEMSKVARNSKDILVTSKALMETQSSLNKYFGQSVVFSGEMAEEFASIAKRTNMSAESQGLFALESMKTGKTAKTLLKGQITQTMELNKQYGLQMSNKQVQDAIGKTSKSLQLTFKGSVKELTKQVMAAKALGVNMETVANIANSLLDFESSIQAELEAELLLGKDINLEKARQAALEGDMGKVAEEVLKNKAIMHAFETKNVIAQEAAAKALGMGREDLAAMIKEQEKMEAIREAGFDSMNEAQEGYNDKRKQGMSIEQAAKEVGGEALKDQLESASVAERFTAMMERVQEIFISFAEPILAIVDGFMTWAGGAERLANILLTIAGLYAAIKLSIIGANIAKGLGVILSKKEEGAEKKKAIAKIGGVAAAFVTNPIGAAIGLAAGLIATGVLMSKMNDGVIGPGGEMVVSGPKGSIQLDKEDSIIAGTNLGGKGKQKSEGGGGARRDAALIAEVRTLIAINKRILDKNWTVEMGGNEVGQGINTAERQIQ